jgi:hypothetical protein
MAFSTITSEMESAAVAQIASSSFYATFGDTTISEALRQPLAQQSTKVRRAIKESYKKSLEESNQTGVTDSYLTSVDDPNDSSIDDKANKDDDTGSFEEEDIYYIVNGVLVQKTFLTKEIVESD